MLMEEFDFREEFEEFSIFYKINKVHIDFLVYEEYEIESTTPFIRGSIKWDSCSNWDFQTDDCLRHFCSRSEYRRMARLLDRMHDITAEKLPTFDKDFDRKEL